MNNNLYNSDGLYRGLFSQKPDPKPLTKQSMQEQQKYTLAGGRHFFASSYQGSPRAGMVTRGRNGIAVPTHDDKSCSLCPHRVLQLPCAFCSERSILHAIHGHG
jgi:hypothetical protein